MNNLNLISAVNIHSRPGRTVFLISHLLRTRLSSASHSNHTTHKHTHTHICHAHTVPDGRVLRDEHNYVGIHSIVPLPIAFDLVVACGRPHAVLR